MMLEERDLNSLYVEALSIYKDIDMKYEEESCIKCILFVEECKKRVSSLALFSSNETLQDLLTTYIKFLSLEYYLGILWVKLRISEVERRRENLERSIIEFEEFIRKVSLYDLLDSDTLKLMKQEGTETSSRDLKIMRFKAIKSLKNQANEAMVLLGNDEEVERERCLAILRMHALEAVGEIESINNELALLSNRDGVPTDQPIKAKGIKSTSTRITKPFTIIPDRQQMARQVFRAGHCLPTMTIDEYLTIERERGGILPSSNTQINNANLGIDEDRDEFVDIKTYKDRSFDIFKDDNIRGSGNTYNIS